MLRHRLTVPQPIAAAFRALGALEGSLTILTSTLDIVAVARQQGSALLATKIAPAEIRATLETQLATILPLLQRTPRKLNRIADELKDGTLTINARVLSHEADRLFLTGIVQQVVVALLAAALAIGGILLVIADTGPVMTGGVRLYTYLGFVLLLFAFVLGSRALVLVFRQPTHQTHTNRT